MRPRDHRGPPTDGAVARHEAADAIGIIAGVQNVNTTATTSGGIFNAIIAKNRISGIASTSTTGFSAVGIAIAGDAAGEIEVEKEMLAQPLDRLQSVARDNGAKRLLGHADASA